MKAADWIDRVKTAKKWESDYRVAKELLLSRNTISNYRVGARHTMDESTSIKVAHALNIDPAIVLADQAMEMTKNDEARSAWSAILERLGGVAASVFLSAGLIGGAAFPPDAQSAERSQNGSNSDLSSYTSYKGRRKKTRRNAANWLTGLMPKRLSLAP